MMVTLGIGLCIVFFGMIVGSQSFTTTSNIVDLEAFVPEKPPRNREKARTLKLFGRPNSTVFLDKTQSILNLPYDASFTMTRLININYLSNYYFLPYLFQNPPQHWRRGST